MEKSKINNAKLGFIVIAGILFLVFTLYMIGQNRILFQSTFTIKTEVTDANGLQPGNNVTYMGIKAGTVKSVEMASDTSIYILMRIDNDLKSHIKRDAIAKITSEGLMGNKMVSITAGSTEAKTVEEGDLIASEAPVDTDKIIRSLGNTSSKIELISDNLLEITSQFKSSSNFQTLLTDTLILVDLKKAIGEIREAGSNLSSMAATGNNLLVNLDQGEGLVPQLFTDTVLVNKMESAISKIEKASQETVLVMEDARKIAQKMKAGEGTAGMLLTDSLMRKKLFESAVNIEEGFSDFNAIMDAIKQSFLFRGYFRKQEKEKKKEK